MPDYNLGPLSFSSSCCCKEVHYHDEEDGGDCATSYDPFFQFLLLGSKVGCLEYTLNTALQAKGKIFLS